MNSERRDAVYAVLVSNMLNRHIQEGVVFFSNTSFYPDKALVPVFKFLPGPEVTLFLESILHFIIHPSYQMQCLEFCLIKSFNN